MKSKILAWLSILFIAIGSQVFDFSNSQLHSLLSVGLVIGILALFFYYDGE
jgi:hypothetical protein